MSATSRDSHTIEVWSDFACFSRPEMKVERFSYPCPTPSAARGVFEAIYFKPAFRWQVTRIELLEMPAYIALRRNEVKDKIAERSVQSMIAGKSEPEPLFADLTGDESRGRTQRQTMALRSPRFRLSARIVPRGDEPVATFDQQFIRRAKCGKCFQQPYLGCKEFVCFFDYVADVEGEKRKPVPHTQDLGFMLYDVFDLSAVNASRAEQTNPNKKLRRTNEPAISLFKAMIRDGVLDVPDYESDAVLKPGRMAG